jgi:hypothetical protein
VIRRAVALCLGLLLVAPAAAQRVQTYTNTETGTNLRPLGYPVPLPIASLTPVEGFRQLASLQARLQALAEASPVLSAHDVGRSVANRTVWAYVVGSAGDLDVEGRSKPAFFINASTHAREWAAPEVSTYLVERMVAGATDGGLTEYVVDNTRLVIIPVHNIDGRLQTERFPTTVVVGQDPRSPNDWPRDGRMRRKNMAGVDEVLTTFDDHLLGTDLNRNHPPFWGSVTQGGQLTNPRDLTFRGTAAHGEPESRALVQASQLGPPSRYRLGIDVHSFSRVFFSSNTARTRLNQIQARLIDTLRRHHLAVPDATGAANNRHYTDVPDPPNSGIGTASEYFAYEWLVPSWTLELEPGNGGGTEYGGRNDSHSGFILPASEVRRVREAWAETHLVAFYQMAGAPHLARLRLFDEASGVLLLERRWRWNAETRRRELVESRSGALAPGQRLRVELGFSKPMRHRVNGLVVPLPGQDSVPLAPRIWQVAGGQRSELDVAGGQWLAERGLRYRDDSYRFGMVAPVAGSEFALEVDVQDMVGQQLDADPATPVDWDAGAWTAWEDGSGVAGDTGGIDRGRAITLGGTASGALPALVGSAPALAGEGDLLRLRLRLEAARSEAVTVFAEEASITNLRPNRQPPRPPVDSVQWAPGETGERTLHLRLPEDLAAEADRDWQGEIGVRLGEAAVSPLLTVPLRLLDNDRPAQPVVRAHEEWLSALALLGEGGTLNRELVLDGGRDYFGVSNPLTACQEPVFTAPLRVFGNRARLRPGSASCSTLRTVASGRGSVQLVDLAIDGRRAGEATPATPGIDARGGVALQRVLVEHTRAPALASDGPVSLDRVVLRASVAGDGSVLAASSLSASTSSLLDTQGSASLVRVDDAAEGAVLADSSLVGNTVAQSLLQGRLGVGRSLLQGNRNATPSCTAAVGSLGGNLFDGSDCAFTAAGDARDTRLSLAAASGPDRAWVFPVAAAIDRGEGCGAVDLRGAPRPQTLTDGPPRCDAGAVELGVNPWRGFWIPTRDGHGFDIQTRGNVLFVLWYTYAEDGTPTAYQAAAPLTGEAWGAPLLLASRNPTTGAISNVEVGRLNILFRSDTTAEVSWRFDARGSEGREAIRAYAFAEGEPRVEITGTWFTPVEDGWGLSVARRGDVTAIALYYYDAAGRLRWALGSGGGADAVDIAVDSFTGFCPDCDAAANPVRAQPAGRVLLHMLTPQRLRVDTAVNDPGGGSWQRQFASFVPIGDPVDNRAAAAQLGRR